MSKFAIFALALVFALAPVAVMAQQTQVQRGVRVPSPGKSYSARSIAPAHAVGVQPRKPKFAHLQQRLSVLQQRIHRHGARMPMSRAAARAAAASSRLVSASEAAP